MIKANELKRSFDTPKLKSLQYNEIGNGWREIKITEPELIKGTALHCSYASKQNPISFIYKQFIFVYYLFTLSFNLNNIL